MVLLCNAFIRLLLGTANLGIAIESWHQLILTKRRFDVTLLTSQRNSDWNVHSDSAAQDQTHRPSNRHLLYLLVSLSAHLSLVHCKRCQ